jgi:hypothetical protein
VQVIEVMPQFQVMARCQPSDKLRLVRLLRQLDQIVAVTVRSVVGSFSFRLIVLTG